MSTEPAATRRETRRTVVLNTATEPHLAMIRIRKAYSDAFFRPTRVVETLIEESPMPVASRLASGLGYSVTVSGPVVTAKGADHASQRGDRRFEDQLGASGLSDIPDALRAHLVGPGALSGALEPPAD